MSLLPEVRSTWLEPFNRLPHIGPSQSDSRRTLTSLTGATLWRPRSWKSGLPSSRAGSPIITSQGWSRVSLDFPASSARVCLRRPCWLVRKAPLPILPLPLLHDFLESCFAPSNLDTPRLPPSRQQQGPAFTLRTATHRHHRSKIASRQHNTPSLFAQQFLASSPAASIFRSQ